MTELLVNGLNAEFNAGYRLGFDTGMDVGYAHGVDDEGAAWTAVFTGCVELWRQPMFAEVTAARKPSHDPCRTKCDSCSQCVHSRAWWRRGGRPYLGVEAERERAQARREAA